MGSEAKDVIPIDPITRPTSKQDQPNEATGHITTYCLDVGLVIGIYWDHLFGLAPHIGCPD